MSSNLSMRPNCCADAPAEAADANDEADIMAAVRLVQQRDAAVQRNLPVRALSIATGFVAYQHAAGEHRG